MPQVITPAPKPIRLSAHAKEQCVERGTNAAEVELAIRKGRREPAKLGRWMYRYNIAFNQEWNGRRYAIKQVAPIVAERPEEFIVVTVYTFFF